ncbi:MAG: chromate transporter [Rhodospirillales bacterium]|nr:chromate transporter [Rhodospirillales bacterium]
MIWFLLFFEFLKIGLFALGGGLVTVPFLFDLSSKYGWFSSQELIDMIAVSESSPGPIGVNMATYVGFKTAGVLGGIVATIGLVLPSLIIVIIVAKILDRYRQSPMFNNLMYAVHPASIAMILFAGIELGKMVLISPITIFIAIIFWGAIHFVKLHPVLYIILGGIVGVILKL